jgi:hypothetical protein
VSASYRDLGVKRGSVSSLKFGDVIRFDAFIADSSVLYAVVAVDDGSADPRFDGDRVVTLFLRSVIDDSYSRRVAPYWLNVDIIDDRDGVDVKPRTTAFPDLGDTVEVNYPGAQPWTGVVTARLYEDSRDNSMHRVDVLCLTREHVDRVYKAEYRVEIAHVTIV